MWKMPSPLLKMKQRSSGGNVTVPNQSQTNKEGRGVVGIGGNVSSGDMQQAREDRDKMEKEIYSLLRHESPHRAAKTVALARIHDKYG